MIGGIRIKEGGWRKGKKIKMESFKIPIITDIMSP